MNQEKLEIMRHSCAHLVAAAIYDLYPEAKFGVGPAVENGFYYDIKFPVNISEADLEKIAVRAEELKSRDLPFIREEMSLDEAIEFFSAKGQDFKVELLQDLKNKGTTRAGEDMGILDGKTARVSLYRLGEFTDLCRGPHVKSAGEVGAFQLTKLAGAYWRGDEKNPQLQRIYGLCFAQKKELKNYLNLLAEAEKRDHRKLGKEMNLFHIDETVGQGLPLWHPKGAILWRIIEDFWYSEHLKNGYQLVRTPHIGNRQLWEISGHWGFYNESMYPPLEAGQTLKASQDKEKVKEPEQFLLKPMNCPFHVQIYKHHPHSYREMPFRFAECGTVYRFEKKGELSGLTRVRGFTQDDAHIICRADQVEFELGQVVDFILFIYESFGFKTADVNVYLSVRDPESKKYAGSDEGWNFTEQVLEKVAREKKLNITKDVGGAVFYGPKLDFKIKDAIGREWQCSTLQFDFNLPERFAMTYINRKGQEEKPYMLHRALFGSFERFIGVLIEHYAGNFPVWLAPVQIKLIPVSEKHADGAEDIRKKIVSLGVRVEIDAADETLGNRVRKATQEKIPYIIVVGDKELTGEDWLIRVRGEEKQSKMSPDKFLEKIMEEIKERK